MKLKKHPETELEYWATIESLGGFMWRTNHDLCDGRIESTPSIEEDLKESQEILEILVSELSCFGIVHPKECPQTKFGEEKQKAPDGKMWYWDWYNKMEAECYTAEYEKLICSACSLSGGVEEFISGNSIPCTVFCGILYRLYEPFLCAMIHGSGGWDRKKLLTKIEKVGGKAAVVKFETKETELKMA